jgi:selenide,water dikinase
VAIGADLSSLSHSNVFAVGDCAHFTPAPLAKAGVYAVRAADTLFANALALAKGDRPTARFRPRPNFLKLISLGRRDALGIYGSVSLKGRAIWHLKDWIDRRFVDQFKTV